MVPVTHPIQAKGNPPHINAGGSIKPRQPPTSALMTSPNSSQRSPLNRIS